MKTAFIIGFLLYALSLAAVECVQCYVCSGCNDPFDSDSNCGNIVSCDYACTKAKAKAGSIHAVERACGDGALSKGCLESHQGGIGVELCICNTDKCNGSLALKAPLKMFVLLAIIVAVFRNLKL